jgi:hypothetical protein
LHFPEARSMMEWYISAGQTPVFFPKQEGPRCVYKKEMVFGLHLRKSGNHV